MNFYGIHNSEYNPILSNWPENVSIPQIEQLANINSNIQAQLDTKLSSVSIVDITDWPPTVSSTEVEYLNNVTSNIQTQLDNKPDSDVTGIAGATAITNIISISQVDYDAIGAPDSSTLYIIT